MRIMSVGLSLLLAAAIVGGAVAQAQQMYFQGYETDASGWSAYESTVTQVASGTSGITSAAGSYHGILDNSTVVNHTGAYTFFDGSRDTWPNGFKASLDIYLDVNWTVGSGFDYSVAAWGSDGNHQRDYIFHVAKDTSTGSLLVGGSNNSNFETRENLETLSNHLAIGSTGWYTFEQDFYDAGGFLAVDLNLYSSGGTLLFTETRSNTGDTIPGEIGGNGYGWFTFSDIDGLAIDNTSLTVGTQNPIPEPGTVGLMVLGLAGLVGVQSWRRRSR